MNKALLLSIVALLGFTLWRNYGVLPKNAIILNSKFGSVLDNTNEQKELINIIKKTNPNEGDEVKTSFGYYKLYNNNWIKTKEFWE